MGFPLTFASERHGISKRADEAQGKSQSPPKAIQPSKTSTGSTTSTLASSSHHSNHTGTSLLTANVTSPVNTTSSNDQGPKAAVAIGISVAVVLTLVLVIAIVYMLKKGLLKGFLGPTMRRRASSTGSRRPLDLEEPEGSHAPDGSVRGDDRDDMFTIEDMELEEDYEFGSVRNDQEGYIYDEVYAPSQFEDQRTQHSVRHLVNENDDRDDDHAGHGDFDDEMLDFDFETLGIKITDKMDLSAARRYTNA